MIIITMIKYSTTRCAGRCWPLISRCGTFPLSSKSAIIAIVIIVTIIIIIII